MAILSLAFKSLLNRKLTFFITVFSIAISVALLLGVQTLKTETKNSFMKSISGTDLIIGSRGSSSQLLLSSVFHIGNTPNTIKYSSYQEIANSPAVEWAIPISLGDSHKGYKVMATNQAFFKHFSYANQQTLQVQTGAISDDMFAVVIGAEVAKKLNYNIGDKIIVTHEGGEMDGHDHDNIPYHISAILAPSFTAIDQTLVITLEAMEAMHADQHEHLGALPNEVIIPSNKEDQHTEHVEHATHNEHDHDEHKEHAAHDEHDHDEHKEHAAHDEHEHKEHAAHENHDHDEHADHQAHDHHETMDQRIARLLKIKPEKINAVFVGLTSRHAVLGMQNAINNFKAEPLSAIIPAVALQELWQFFSVAEVALNIVAIFVVLVGLLGMLSIILMSLNERRREMAILRSVGARPGNIFALIMGEAAFVCLAGITAGIALLYALLFILQAPLANTFGFYLEINMLTISDLKILGTIQLSAMLIAILPGVLIYKTSLADGMNIKF